MIKNMLTRRKESDTCLATVSRHRYSRQITMKIREIIVAFSQYCGFHQLMKATVLTESYNNFSIFIAIHLLQRCPPTVAKQVSFSFLLVNNLSKAIAGYICRDHTKTEDTIQELQIQSILNNFCDSFLSCTFFQVLESS